MQQFPFPVISLPLDLQLYQKSARSLFTRELSKLHQTIYSPKYFKKHVSVN